MKKILIPLLALLLCLSLTACQSEDSNSSSEVEPKKVERIINQNNIEDYVNIQLVFDNAIYVNDHLSCMCYVQISPKADYEFESVSIDFTIDNSDVIANLNNNWKINNTVNSFTKQEPTTVYLDKDGYGTASLYFYNSGTGTHPLTSSGDWLYYLKGAKGKVCIYE